MRRHINFAAVSVLFIFLAEGTPGPALGQFPIAIPNDPRGWCRIETRSPTFGEYDSFDPRPRDAQGAAIYTCVRFLRGLKVRIEMSRGRSRSFHRAMFNESERLNYNLYLDATRQTVWGNGSGGTEYYSDNNPPNGRPVVVPIYGRIAPFQDVAVGTYSDVIEVRILF